MKWINLAGLWLGMAALMCGVGNIFAQGTDQDSVSTVFTNPVKDGADPWITWHGNEYVSSYASGKSIVVSRSPLLTRAGQTKAIWKAPASGWNSCCIWAPEIHFYRGRWYVYYAAGESGPPYVHQRTGVLRSKTSDVFSEYEDMGMLYTGDTPGDAASNIWAIDMTLLEHNGRLYAIWSGWEKQAETDATPQHLYIQEMTDPLIFTGKRVKLSSPEESWETGGPLNLNEGPQILKHGQNLFVVYSCRESWTKEYRLGMLQLTDPGSDPLNPGNWRKNGPVFSGSESVHGVGHASFTRSPDGTEDWIIYHSKKETKPGWRRDVRMQPFGWTAAGLPDFGRPVPAGATIKRPSGEYELELQLKKRPFGQADRH